jgi:dTDP-4-amino-4,6-dideoxygalactose transaminase
LTRLLEPVALARPDTGDQEWLALREVLESGWLTQGPKVAEFEAEFARLVGVPHARACSSGTAGLHLALLALGVGPGDEVIVPAFTWVATANAALYCGATPVFVDVRPDTYNLDVDQVAARLTRRTRVVVPVHLFGLCADVEGLAHAAPGVAVVEDAACAAGATRGGRPAGSLGAAGVFSFHPRKSLTTGEGGMVTTADAALAARVGALRSHGCLEGELAGEGPFAAYGMLGYNFRLTDLQAAIGLVQLRKLENMIATREALARAYAEALSGIPWLRLPQYGDAAHRHAWQAYVCRVSDDAPCSRDQIMAALASAGIATRPGTMAVPLTPFYRQRLGHAPGDFPVAAALERDSLALPLHTRMGVAEVARVARALEAIR